jgi:ABC-type transport system involved in Fe-S cluster assembly fused permease/ATPase subunit
MKKVAQAAFVQLSVASFGHLLSLSLDYHSRKKPEELLRMYVFSIMQSALPNVAASKRVQILLILSSLSLHTLGSMERCIAACDTVMKYVRLFVASTSNR